MKPNLKPVPKESWRPVTLLEQTRRDFIRATRHLQDAGKRRLKFASPLRASERGGRSSDSPGRIEHLSAALSL